MNGKNLTRNHHQHHRRLAEVEPNCRWHSTQSDAMKHNADRWLLGSQVVRWLLTISTATDLTNNWSEKGRPATWDGRRSVSRLYALYSVTQTALRSFLRALYPPGPHLLRLVERLISLALSVNEPNE